MKRRITPLHYTWENRPPLEEEHSSVVSSFQMYIFYLSIRQLEYSHKIERNVTLKPRNLAGERSPALLSRISASIHAFRVCLKRMKIGGFLTEFNKKNRVQRAENWLSNWEKKTQLQRKLGHRASFAWIKKVTRSDLQMKTEITSAKVVVSQYQQLL